MKKSDIEAIRFNRRHSEFIEDYGCLRCDYFSMCANKCGRLNFTCPLEKTDSDIYKLNVAKNFAELCDVLEEPSVNEWKALANGTEHQFKYNLSKLHYIVTMPKCEPLKDWQKEHSIGETKTHVTCQFTMSELRKRLREFLVYTPMGFTLGNEICNQLIGLLVPMDYTHLFQFTKEN